LKICLEALNLNSGDEVIVPAHTFIATFSAVIQTGLLPVPADVNPDTFTIDPQHLSSLITNRTRVVIPVHLYGFPAEMSQIMEFSAEKNLFVIEDFAQSTGAKYRNARTGSLGIINGTSFYPVKSLGAFGDGGIITTNNKEMADFCLKYRNYGSLEKYHFEMIGFNSRLDELQAAMLSVKLRQLDKWIGEKNKIARRYIDNLKEVPDIQLPAIKNHFIPSWHIFPVLCEKRDELQTYLNTKGIETLVHYPVPAYRQPALKFLQVNKENFPVTEMISRKELSLPIYPGLSDEEVDYISECILDFYKSN